MLKDRNFLTLLDFTPQEIKYLLDLSAELKQAKYTGNEQKHLLGKNIALIFERDSTRTRCAFEVAALDQGANVTYLGPTGSHMGKKESLKDTIRVLDRMYDGIEYRGFSHEKVKILGEHSKVPVWNGLTSDYHPTQILADLFTMMEHSDRSLDQISLAFLGNAPHNVGNSLLIGAAMMGMDFRSVAPKENQPAKYLVDQAKEIAKETGASISVTDDPEEGVKGCDFLYTDVWISMGGPEEVWRQRIEMLKPFQVNKQLMEKTGKPNTKFMHCLPAFHNCETTIGEEVYEKFQLEEMEVTEDVFESESSIVFEEAENRLHTIKALMVATLGTSKK